MKQVKQPWNKAQESQQGRNLIEDLSPGFSNVKAIAKYLGMKSSNIYSKVESREIPHYRIGRLVRFKLEEIEAWMEGQKKPVVDVKVETRKVMGSFQKKSGLDVGRIVKKAIDGARQKGYTSRYGKPDQIKGLRKEVQNGTL
jgi:excisionase family DNA binding protein